MELVLNAASAVGSFIAGLTNYITDLFLTPPLTATLRYLEDTDLKTLTGEKQTVKAKSLWKSSGAVIMAVRRPG